MNIASVRPTFADTISAFGAENLTCQICGTDLKSQAAFMSFSLDAVRVDGTIVGNNPINDIDPSGLIAAGSIGSMSAGYQGPPATAEEVAQGEVAMNTMGIALAFTPAGVVPIILDAGDATLSVTGLLADAGNAKIAAEVIKALGLGKSLKGLLDALQELKDDNASRSCK